MSDGVRFNINVLYVINVERVWYYSQNSIHLKPLGDIKAEKACICRCPANISFCGNQAKLLLEIQTNRLNTFSFVVIFLSNYKWIYLKSLSKSEYFLVLLLIYGFMCSMYTCN